MPHRRLVPGFLTVLSCLLCWARAVHAQAPGERFALTDAQLYVPGHFAPASDVIDVVLHLHGSHALAQDAFYASAARAVLVTVALDGLSSVYTRHFAPGRLQALLGEAFAKLAARYPTLRPRLGVLVVTAFSAGYGGVREMLARDYDRVDAVILGDGLHTGYVPGRLVDPAQMTGFVRLARDAVVGGKPFLFSHSAIVPGSYASTTECADYLIAAVGGQRVPWSGTNALGMVQHSKHENGRFGVFGFAGNRAADHVLHFQLIWHLLDRALPQGSGLPVRDDFPASGRQARGWLDKFTAPLVRAVTPAAPGGDGFALVVQDPRGGYDSTRIGGTRATDYFVQCDVYCEHRPELSADGFERVGVFLRDDGNGGFEGQSAGGGSCYALCWDSHDGKVSCLRAVRGVVTDLLAAPVHLRGSAWRRMRIEARGDRLAFLVEGTLVLATRDGTFRSGPCGIGYHEYFQTNAHMRGTRADHFVAEELRAAAWEELGAGCAGSAGVPRLGPAAGQLPWLGAEFVIEVAPLGQATPFGLAGASATMWGTQSLPLDLGPFGMPSCWLRVSPDVAVALRNDGGRALWTIPIPNDPELAGRAFFGQAALIDAGANALGTVFTNAGRATVAGR